MSLPTSRWKGQVYSANAFVYTPGLRVGDYLQRAGGPDRQADKRRIFLLRADGSVISRQYADVSKAAIYPGDTVVVPPIIDKRAFVQRLIDITSVIGNLGTGIRRHRFVIEPLGTRWELRTERAESKVIQ